MKGEGSSQPRTIPRPGLGPLVPQVARTGGPALAGVGVLSEQPKAQAPGPKQKFKPLAGYGR